MGNFGPFESLKILCLKKNCLADLVNNQNLSLTYVCTGVLKFKYFGQKCFFKNWGSSILKSLKFKLLGPNRLKDVPK